MYNDQGSGSVIVVIIDSDFSNFFYFTILFVKPQLKAPISERSQRDANENSIEHQYHKIGYIDINLGSIYR
jgi:hypothetical protein